MIFLVLSMHKQTYILCYYDVILMSNMDCHAFVHGRTCVRASKFIANDIDCSHQCKFYLSYTSQTLSRFVFNVIAWHYNIYIYVDFQLNDEHVNIEAGHSENIEINKSYSIC